MPEIQGGRWDAFLRRLFSLKEGVISPSIAPEIQPIVDAQPPGAEYEVLRTVRLCSSKVQVGAVAGQFATVFFANPAGSNTIAVVHKIGVWTHSLAGTVFLDWNTSPVLTISVPSTHRDTRLTLASGAGIVTTCGLRSQTNTPILSGTTIWQIRIQQNRDYGAPHVWPTPIVVTPGNEFFLTFDQVNTVSTYSVAWTERAAEPSELEV